MKRNMKITISALAVMLVMALAVTVLSFSLADDKNDGNFNDKPVLIADTADMYTNIDNIIENSYASGTDVNPVYKIVEIGSAQGKPSSLETYVSSKGFETYVLNGHATIQNVMNEDCIEYTYYWVGDVTDENEEALKNISNADFIYVSHDSSQQYTPSNDLSEELYNILHTYAVGVYNPIVIDKPAATTAGGGGNSSTDEKTYSLSALAANTYDLNGMYYYTFKWPTGVSASSFLQHQEGSMYLGINGTKKKDNWTTVAKQGTASPDTAASELKMAEILVVNGATNSVTLANTLLADAGTPVTDLVDVAANSAVTGTVYDIKTSNSLLYRYGYNARYTRPDYARVTIAKIGDTATLQLDKYDMVIIESEAGSESISVDVYKQYAAAMYGNVSIVYPQAMSSGGGSTGGTGGSTDMPSDEQETNYAELYYMVATSNDMAKYQNVMVTTKAEFDIVTTSKSVATADVIADLINSSAFRGIGGPSATSNMFTVLEIQPCYPIDEQLAEEIGAKTPKDTNQYPTAMFGTGNYYLKPAQVVNGKTKEEIPDGTEYYQWELSKAKIADITGLSVNQINLVQMSSEELASDKSEILGNYDLIYIGANISAKKSAEQYVSVVNTTNYNSYVGAYVTPENIKYLPIYTTYSHSGDIVRTTVATYGGVVQGKVAGSAPLTIGDTTYTNTFAVMNGNDITYNNYIALTEYVEAGMPVVFSKDASMAYKVAKDEGYLQNSLDPDSNMYKFMSMCNSITAYKTTPYNKETDNNILWNFDNTKVVTADNDGGVLGETNTGYVMVFAGTHNNRTSDFIATTEYTTSTEGDNKELVDLLANSNVRPRLTLTNFPATYNMYDSTTKLTNKTLTYEYRVTTGANYEVKLYIDDNGNSKFEDSEVVATGNKEKLTYTVADSFYGPLYWMIEVKAAGNMTTNQTGIAYIKNVNNQKQTIRVLQIMPEQSKCEKTGGERTNGASTLYFCTVCQQTYGTLKYNPDTISGDRYHYGSFYQGLYSDNENGMGKANENLYLGLHEHKFGIVKYDSSLDLAEAEVSDDIIAYGPTGMDDWDQNLADEVSDLYDFDLDIMYRDVFEETCLEVVAAYDFSKMTDEAKEQLVSAAGITNKDPEYEKFAALETLDEKVKFVKMREYSKEASELYAQYSAAKSVADEKEEVLIEKIEVLKANAASLQAKYFTSYTVAELEDELQRLIDEEAYWDMFSLHARVAQSNNFAEYFDEGNFHKYYNDYVVAKDAEINYHNAYKKAYRLANPDNWVYNCYDSVVIGAAEDFGGDDFTEPVALADLVDFIDADGTLILFHDSLTRFADEGSVNLTNALREKVGMDRYHFKVDESKVVDQVVKNNVLYNGDVSYKLSIYDATGNNVEAEINSTFSPSVKDNNLDAKCTYQKNWYWTPGYSWNNTNSSEGTMSDAGTVNVNVNVSGISRISENDQDSSYAETNIDFADRKVVLDITTYGYNDYDNTSFTGTLDENGKCTFAIKNYRVNTTTYGADAIYYTPFVTTGNPNKYFMSNLSYKTDDTKYASWLTDMKQAFSATGSLRLSGTAHTDVVAISDQSGNHLASPYKHVELKWNEFVAWNYAGNGTEKSFTNFGTNKASQNNEGIITLFPFTLSDELNIAGTHSQGYALDIESDDMTVWYSLAAGNNKKTGSSIFAASPRDGMDNYFIYSYGSVYYCGAGHSKVTGIGKDNNDERRLYINIICNSVRKSVMQPDIFVYDYETTKNEKFKKDADGNYVVKVDTTDEYPEFSFLVTLDEDTSIKQVRIYYDLDYMKNDTDLYTADANHPLIVTYTAADVTKGVLKNVFRYDGKMNPLLDENDKQIPETWIDENGQENTMYATMLKLQPRYFDPYNQSYTYIIIEVTDSEGNTSYKRIKVQLKDHLFNLT